LLGPLYHLIDRADRIQAIKEAKRVLKPNGILIAAIISRYASLIDGLNRNLIADVQFVKMLKQDLKTGIHINQTDNPEYFTTSFFHTPDEIEMELRECDLQFEKLIAVESIGWLYKPGEPISDLVLELIRQVETNKDFLASSPHILAIARKS
jgi:SAM-dependent methyltransferase